MRSKNFAAILMVFLFFGVFSSVSFASCSYSSILCNATNNDTEPCLLANETYNFTYYFVECSDSMGFDGSMLFNTITVYPASPQTYPISDVLFNLNLEMNNASIYHNFSGDFNLYPMENDTENEFYYILNFSPSAGYYAYEYYFTNDTGTYTINQTFEYVIEPGVFDMELTLDGEENNKTYTINQIANFSAFLPIENETIYLYSNYPGWVVQSSNESNVSYSLNLTQIGEYNITAFWDGNENYTNGSKIYYFRVTDLNWTDIKTYPNVSANYSKDQNYSFEITWDGNVSDVIFEANFLNGTQTYTNSNLTTYENITVNNSGNTYWINFTDLPASTYTYRWIATDNNSFEVATDNITYYIGQFPTTMLFTLSPTSVISEGSVTASCHITPNDQNLTLYLYRTTGGFTNIATSNNTLYNTFTAPSATTTVLYTYECWFYGNDNYSSAYGSVVLTVEGGSNDFVSNSGGSSNTDTTSVQGQFTLSPSESNIVMDAGNSKVISFSLINTYENDINVTSITVSGIEDSWYALDKTVIPRLNDGTTEKVKMTLNVPEDSVANTYSIKVKAIGKNLFSGATLTRETTVTLTVNSNFTAAVVAETEEAETVEQATLSTEEETLGNWVLPTGLLSMSSEYFPYMILILGVVFSVIVFMKRDAFTQNLIKIGGLRTKKKSDKSVKDMISISLPKLKRKGEKKELKLKEEKIKSLETEIEKDIKELQNIMESEKKVKKNRK
ncbi:MAG: hypothetical protein JW700_02805 [Candidatus Aenigmarchaeota archaeon]|nr:hypothetical protein [Candidatus Aenigmarchaeota archaeon]